MNRDHGTAEHWTSRRLDHRTDRSWVRGEGHLTEWTLRRNFNPLLGIARRGHGECDSRGSRWEAWRFAGDDGRLSTFSNCQRIAAEVNLHSSYRESLLRTTESAARVDEYRISRLDSVHVLRVGRREARAIPGVLRGQPKRQDLRVDRIQCGAVTIDSLNGKTRQRATPIRSAGRLP